MPKLFVYLNLIIFHLLIAAHGFAECDCGRELIPETADVVFIGKVIQTGGKQEGWSYGGYWSALMEVERFGSRPESIKVIASDSKPEVDCSNPAVLGREYRANCTPPNTQVPFTSSLVVVDSEAIDSACHISFEQDQKYMVYVKRIELGLGNIRSWKKGEVAERWWTSPCLGTKMIIAPAVQSSNE